MSEKRAETCFYRDHHHSIAKGKQARRDWRLALAKQAFAVLALSFLLLTLEACTCVPLQLCVPLLCVFHLLSTQLLTKARALVPCIPLVCLVLFIFCTPFYPHGHHDFPSPAIFEYSCDRKSLWLAELFCDVLCRANAVEMFQSCALHVDAFVVPVEDLVWWSGRVCFFHTRVPRPQCSSIAPSFSPNVHLFPLAALGVY